jgi:hypothetical protein
MPTIERAEVPLAEVLAATPDDAATRKVTEAHAPYEQWKFVGREIGRIWMQHPDTRCESIASLFADFKAWLTMPERTTSERNRYTRCLAAVSDGSFQRVWTNPIVLGAAAQIHDGKHRLVSTYEFSITARDVSISVFWGRRRGP